MKSRLSTIALMAGLLVCAAYVGLRVFGGGGEDDAVAAGPPPDVEGQLSSSERFFASDRRLLQDGPHAIREKARAANGKGQPGVPYYIELADGRYAFGHTDAFGNTRPLFTDGPIAHKVHWDDEALARTKAALGAPPEPPDAVASKGIVQRWNDTVDGLGLPRFRKGRAAYTGPAPRTTTVATNSCVIATSGDSPVAKACALGGRPQAKQEMKNLLTIARANGKKFTCDACHADLDSYELTENARIDFPALLSAADVEVRRK